MYQLYYQPEDIYKGENITYGIIEIHFLYNLTANAEKYQVTPAAIAVSWITRHPADIQVILGTTKDRRLLESAEGSEIPLTREEWYGLYREAGNMIP